jgi:hypothetical protein
MRDRLILRAQDCPSYYYSTGILFNLSEAIL